MQSCFLVKLLMEASCTMRSIYLLLINPWWVRRDLMSLEAFTYFRFPLKAVKVMHTVALRTEATISGSEMPANLGQAFKNHMSEMFAYHATIMSNTLGTSIVVFTRTGFMATLLSHYRPSGTIFAFINEKTIQQRLAVCQGVCPICMQFSEDAEETFSNALALLQKQGMVKEGEEVALLQSGRQPIWRFQSTHNIQVRKV
ncbi:plastidial pyruvate kinase 2-like isoform X2 [Quercus robur]|uniref:plastidial pyruvate kinase 2-like isoform X2 n=1 Tax=Quercus robur TaxID=38942 RepID=UPI002162095A|nr:plastidial pyruvate kinase 2-like isoform X2 [Quercus robur]